LLVEYLLKERPFYPVRFHMMARNELRSAKRPSRFDRLFGLAYLVFTLAGLAWAKEFLLPIVLAAFTSFLLAPLISRLERAGIKPVIAVLGVVTFAFVIIGAVCATISVQSLELVNSLPKYHDNIRAKWVAIQHAPPGPVNSALRNAADLVDDLSKVSGSATTSPRSEPTKVQIVNGAESTLALIRNSASPILGPVGEFAVVIVLVVFMLLERHKLRDRVLRLIGHSYVGTTTIAVDEAGSRLSRGLLMQLQINAALAVVLAIGLSLIGIPNAILWALLALVLRFLPYIGIWVSAAFPLILSLAVSTSWITPVLTLGLYIVAEVFTNNVIEPYAIGGSTGISPLAVIFSALFWTWLWGPIGLFLATPLTSFLVVMGRYFPTFQPLELFLAEDTPLSLDERLARDLKNNRESDARVLIHSFGDRLSTELVDELVIPAVRRIENDQDSGRGGRQRKARAYQLLHTLIDEIVPPSKNSEQSERPAVVIAPCSCEGDQFVGEMLALLLVDAGVEARTLSWELPVNQQFELLKSLEAGWTFFSAINPDAYSSVGAKAHFVQTAEPQASVAIGLWSLPPEGAARAVEAIRSAADCFVYTSMGQAVLGIVSRSSPTNEETVTPVVFPAEVNDSRSPVD
jgi:predicted PurR-regulated permease PerM